MDSLDIFICLTNKDNASIHKGLRLLFRRIFNGRIHECMEAYLTNMYLFCLHKDEKDLYKLRPIGVPTALRRIITNHIARSYRRKFSFDLLPFNYAIGIDSGMDFVVKASQLSVEKYITSKQNKGEAPSRCFVSLDLKNMFNELSREKIFEIVEHKYPELPPLSPCFTESPALSSSKWTMASGTPSP